VIFEGKEWDAEPVMIRDHTSCYATPPIPLPHEDMDHEQWLREAIMRFGQEVTAARIAGFERQDWADAVCHVATVYNGAMAMITNVISHYLPPLESLRLRGELSSITYGVPSTILSRVCDDPTCGDREPGHTQYALLIGDESAGKAESNYFPPEWMIDGTPE
jgi:hypothetical protein